MANTAQPEHQDALERAIAADIKARPEYYREAGQWLDEHFSDAVFAKRERDERAELLRKEKEGTLRGAEADRVARCKGKPYRKQFSKLRRFGEAVRSFRTETIDKPTEAQAKRVLLLTWLMTDPHANDAGLGLTEFEDWAWEPNEGVHEFNSRRFAGELLEDSGDRSEWVQFVLRCWDSVRPSSSEHPGRIEALADALFEVENKADDWRRAVQEFTRANDGRPRAAREVRESLCDGMDQMKAAVLEAVEAAEKALEGTDSVIRLVKGTRQGQWRSELAGVLQEFRNRTYGMGHGFTHGRGQPPFQAFLSCVHGEQRWLRTVDESDADGDTGTQYVATRAGSVLEYPVKQATAAIAEADRKDREHTKRLVDSLYGEDAESPTRGKAESAPQDARAGASSKRSWTQRDLDSAIREYKAKRAVRYADMLAGVEDGKPGAEKAAHKLFGRNAIARALGVRSPSMVSKSPAWIAMARELRIPLARDRARGSRRTRGPGKIGLEKAVEQAGVAEAQATDPAARTLRAEREETLRQIRQLAPTEAKSILEKYEAGEMTDEQARGTVAALLGKRT